MRTTLTRMAMGKRKRGARPTDDVGRDDGSADDRRISVL